MWKWGQDFMGVRADLGASINEALRRLAVLPLSTMDANPDWSSPICLPQA